MLVKEIKPDSYLKSFTNLCRNQYGNNLIGVGIYGSYAWGYFDEKKSDYDVFLVFNHRVKNEVSLNNLEKISLQYSHSKKQLLKLISEGHWSLYITLLEGAKMLYHTRDYDNFISKLGETDFVDNLKNTDRIKFKAGFDTKVIRENKGYDGAKYALPALRSRLQLLTYIKYRKPIWDLRKVIRLNDSFLTDKEKSLVIQLDKSVKKRRDVFPNKKMALSILDKINRETLFLLKSYKN